MRSGARSIDPGDPARWFAIRGAKRGFQEKRDSRSGVERGAEKERWKEGGKERKKGGWKNGDGLN